MRTIARLTGMAGLMVLAACSDSTGPTPDTFDAARVDQGLTVVEQVAASAVLRSFDALGNSFGGAQPVAVGADRFLAAVQTVTRMVRPEVNAALVPIIQSGSLGQTFVYQVGTGTYVVDPARTGAPTNGVRFILYQLASNGAPTATEIGYADLVDELAGSAAGAGLRLTVVSGSTTHLDYHFALAGTIASASVTVNGYLSDGTDRVNFEITTTGQMFGRSGPVTLEARLEVPSEDFVVTTRVTGEAGETNGDGVLDFKVQARADVLQINSTNSAGNVDATVKVNGGLFATVTGPQDNVVIKGDGGRELTNAELHALGHAVEFAGGVFETLGGLLAPVGVLLLIGLGL